MRFSITLGAILFSLLLFGCISMDYVHKLERNGDSVLTMSANLSAIEGMAESMGGSSMEEQQVENCQEKIDADPELECTYADGILTLSKRLTLEDSMYTFEVEKEFIKARYTFTLERMPDIDPTSDISDDVGMGGAGDLGSMNTPFTDPEAAVEAESLKQFASVTYTVEMPGKIISAEGAEEIENGRATFDVFERMESGKNIVVVSEEDDYLMLILIGIGVLVIVGIAAFALLKLRK